MNCNELQNFLGDAIDKFLPKHLEEEFHSHLEVCRACRNTYELEVLAKTIVQKNVQRVTTPPSISSEVTFSLQKEYSASVGHTGGLSGWVARVFGSRPLFPTLATGFALAVFLYFFVFPAKDSRSETAHDAANDIMNQTLANFSLVRSGEMQPKFVSYFPEAVQAFFEKSGFGVPVSMVNLPDCEWYGADYSEYRGVKLAHIVYKIGNETLYVCEVKRAEALSGSILHLPPAAKKDLARSGWYTDPSHGDDCNIVVWIQDGTLCAASSTMNKKKMLAMLVTP